MAAERNPLTEARKGAMCAARAYELMQSDRTKSLAIGDLEAAQVHIAAALEALRAEARDG